MTKTWQELQAAIPWEVLREQPAVAAVPTPAPVPPMPSPTTARHVMWPALFVALIGALALFALGYNIRPVARPERAIPALSLPTDTPAPAMGPRRASPPAPSNTDIAGRAKWLLSCYAAPSFLYYETHEAASRARWDVCGGSGSIHEPIKK